MAWKSDDDPSIAVATINISFDLDPPTKLHLNMAEWDYLILKPWIHSQWPELCPCPDCWDMREFLQSLQAGEWERR